MFYGPAASRITSAQNVIHQVSKEVERRIVRRLMLFHFHHESL